ncbi:PREDICTED: dual specificity mitogen-activated protein kinase kinase dSOR1-like [Nicrophorus vespilloides]|uniref:mitogen-activated protein kinase kinase n=1 Tax=Nicrophorus vespilloides TaxID=110193 RepID=A0ABM1NBS7_NICVS|nr:PREDICTED: dual specificity mitogen-activated protein kinase kinase dSOR1-like [Nicrophorus vespilloides]XP_017784278.1 PREDICTED: dual specificity mitogen-activated protein kinase kinase dSOR1-like [Nicrophorus vespilloides]
MTEIGEFHVMDEVEQHKVNLFLAEKAKLGDEISIKDVEGLGDIGTGNGAVVVKVRHKGTGIVMARKIIHLEVKHSTKIRIIRDLKVLHDCNFIHIIGFYTAFYLQGEVSLCMEYMNAGSLDVIVRKSGFIPENILGKISVASLRALMYLIETHSIIHNEVKPNNILLNSKGDIKLCDFGASCHLSDSLINSFIGTRSYMSPERLQGENSTVQSDIWALGFTLLEMAIGMYPIPPPKKDTLTQILSGKIKMYNFMDMSIFDILNYVVINEPPTVPDGLFSIEFKDFIDTTLRKDPKARGNLTKLLKKTWSQIYIEKDVDVAGWVCKTMNLEPVKAV